MLLLASTYLNSQNFKVGNNNLNWQKVYADSVSTVDLHKFLRSNNIEAFIENDIISIYTSYTVEQLKPYGYVWSKYPTYLQYGGKLKGIIEFKDQKYRVTLTEITTRNALEVMLEDNISNYIVKRDAIKTQKHHQKVIKTLDGFLTDLFTYKKSDW